MYLRTVVEKVLNRHTWVKVNAIHQIPDIKQTRRHGFQIIFNYGQTGAHSNTQTSFTNTVFVFHESARYEAVGMTKCYIDRCPNSVLAEHF